MTRRRNFLVCHHAVAVLASRGAARNARDLQLAKLGSLVRVITAHSGSPATGLPRSGGVASYGRSDVESGTAHEVRTLTRDGVRLAYREQGVGSPELLFVHAWSADGTSFQPQLDHFGRHHRAAAVDLRGHGASDKPEQEYTPELFADDLAWLARELDLERPVVVGHSMGGVIALVLAARHRDVASAIVAMDSPILPSPELVDAVPMLMEGMRTPAYRDVIRQFYSAFAGFDDDPEQRERLLERLTGGAQHVMASALENVFAADTAAAAAACEVPVLYISSGPWHSDIAQFRRLCPQLVTAQTVGSGHFHQLEVPEQIDAMIERFVALHVRPTDG